MRVLVADDNVDAADSTGWLLRLVGCETQVCYDGPAAVATAFWFRPHVCLLDLNMPGYDGDEAAARIRAALPDDPVVFVALTAMDRTVDRDRTLKAGFVAHLVKPVELADLLAALGL